MATCFNGIFLFFIRKNPMSFPTKTTVTRFRFGVENRATGVKLCGEFELQHDGCALNVKEVLEGFIFELLDTVENTVEIQPSTHLSS